jgi:hypothetical protein
MVDLPAPLGPRSAVTPGAMDSVTSETATTPLNHLLTPLNSTVTAALLIE